MAQPTAGERLTMMVNVLASRRDEVFKRESPFPEAHIPDWIFARQSTEQFCFT